VREVAPISEKPVREPIEKSQKEGGHRFYLVESHETPLSPPTYRACNLDVRFGYAAPR
jgi:hypothetical protein